MKNHRIIILFIIIYIQFSCEVYREPNITTNEKVNPKKYEKTNIIPDTINKQDEEIINGRYEDKNGSTSQKEEDGIDLKPQLPIKSLVVILVINTTTDEVNQGSGTIISSDGYVITNYHIVDNYSRLNGAIQIGMNITDPESVPNTFFNGELILTEKSRDAALLKIKSDIDIMFKPVKIGDSKKLSIGSEITILGFPGVGRNTITMTKGIISGWLDDDVLNINRGWIKTDAEINPGNSGGMAINSKYEFVGIPTRVLLDSDVSGKIGLIRPISVLMDTPFKKYLYLK